MVTSALTTEYHSKSLIEAKEVAAKTVNNEQINVAWKETIKQIINKILPLLPANDSI